MGVRRSLVGCPAHLRRSPTVLLRMGEWGGDGTGGITGDCHAKRVECGRAKFSVPAPEGFRARWWQKGGFAGVRSKPRRTGWSDLPGRADARFCCGGQLRPGSLPQLSISGVALERCWDAGALIRPTSPPPYLVGP